jgi:hypothetical protein
MRAIGITDSDRRRSGGLIRIFTNILMRLELRFRHDGAVMWAALTLPLAVLDRAAPADRLGDDVEALRIIRASIDGMAAPAI